MPERFSHRTDWPEHANRLSELAATLQKQKSDFVDLTASNPAAGGFAFSQRDWLGALKHPDNLKYSPEPLGLRTAREAVAAYYAGKGVEVSPEQIVLTSGTSEAYNFVLRLLTHPGQAVMTPAPSYPLIDLLLDLNDIRQHRYPLKYVGSEDFVSVGIGAGEGSGARAAASVRTSPWAFDAANARQARQPQTRALIAIHPHNPTGHTFSRLERDAVVEFTRSEDMALVVDEVFLDYDTHPKATFASENSVLTFTLSGISKVLGLPQMKLSWIVVSGPEKEQREALRRLEIIADTFLSVGTPVQNALSAWFGAAPEVQAEIRARVDQNRHSLRQAVQGAKPGTVRLLEGSGATWCAILRLADDVEEESFAYNLLERHKVLVHPGYLFDFQSGSHLVVSLLPPPDVFREGARRLFLL